MWSNLSGAAYASNVSVQQVLLHYDGTKWAPIATPAQWTSQRLLLNDNENCRRIASLDNLTLRWVVASAEILLWNEYHVPD